MSQACLNRLPQMRDGDYPVYDDSSKELAFVIPLFVGHPGRLPEEFIKASLWVGNSLVNSTDITDCRFPIYFFVENPIWRKLGQVLMDAGVPRDRVILFDAPPFPYVSQRTMKKIFMIDASELAGFESIVMWDADMFACTAVDGSRHSVRSFVGDTLKVFWYAEVGDDFREIPYWWERLNHEGIMHTFDTIAELVNSLLDVDISRQTLFPYVQSCMVRFPRNLPEGFRDFVLQATSIVAEDELALSLWALKTGKGFDSFLADGSFPVAWSPNDVMRLRQESPYFSHIGDTDDVEDDWEQTWRGDVGICHPVCRI